MSFEPAHESTLSNDRANALLLATLRQALYDAKQVLEMRPRNEPIGLESQAAIEQIRKALDLTNRTSSQLDKRQDKRLLELEEFVDQVVALLYSQKREDEEHERMRLIAVHLRGVELKLKRGKPEI